MMGTHTDITRTKESEQALHHAIAVAESATQVKSELLSTLSHEIRTPLAGIIGLAEKTLQETAADQLIASVEKIHRSANHLLHLLNDSLDYAKLESGRLQCHNRLFDLSALLTELFGLFEPLARRKSISLVADTKAASGLRVFSDELRLRQVLSNLLSNAIKFTEQGEVRLQVQIKPVSEGNAELHFSVRDTGIGIREEIQPRLFNPFEQGGADIGKYGGTGLGLMISQRLVSLLGSEQGIRLQSRPGEGACFSFTLQLPVTRMPVSAENQAQQPLFGRVLIVDDIEINREIARYQLEKLGLQADDLASGQQALDQLNRPESPGYDLVLLDLNMPGLSGADTVRQLKGQWPRLPVIALSASAPDELNMPDLQPLLDGYLQKPLAPDQLRRELSRWLTASAVVEPLSAQRLRKTGGNTPAAVSAPAMACTPAEPESVKGEWLDFAANQRLFAGNTGIFPQLLKDFQFELQQRYIPLLQNLQHCDSLDSEQLIKLHRDTHALKGTAGNLQARPLSEAARAVDDLLRRGERPSGQAVADFGRALQATREEITVYLRQVETDGDGAVSEGAVVQNTYSAQSDGAAADAAQNFADPRLLQQLLVAIQANEFVAPDILQQIAMGMPQDFESQWQQVVRYLDQLEFQAAADQLQSLMLQLQPQAESV